MVREDLKSLEDAGGAVKRFANKKLAHLDEKGHEVELKFSDIDGAIEILEKIIIKYLAIFRAAGWSFLLPVWQYDWTAIFREPWIPNRDHRGEQR